MNFNQALDYLKNDNLLFIALPVFIIAVLLEMYFDRKEHLDLYYGKDTQASIWMMIFTAIVEIGPKLLAFMGFYMLHELSPLKEVVGRQWWAYGLLFFLDDFAYYWFHRMNHEVRLFWAGHVCHHSAIKMNLGTALRQGVGERLHKFFFWMWIPLLGFDPIMMFFVMSLNLIYQFWVHTELVGKLPAPIEFIFNTPSHHRVHHASNIRYLDRNHAGVLILWDRLFGTFSEEKDFDKPVYGLTENLDTFNPIHVATHEYRAIWRDVQKAETLSDKLKYIFYAPGWSHNGEDKRAKTLRNSLNSEY